MISASCLISVIAVILIKSENSNAYLNVSANPGELCNRDCKVGEKPRVCYFEFVLEHYQAMGAACGDCAKGVVEDCFKEQCIPLDGVEKGVMSINRQIPAPPIHVCDGDIILVDVVNNMPGTAASIHWHGLHQRFYPYMDGVPYITQCPILYASTFRYRYKATGPGTHWYHGHAGHHKANGHFGALILRQPRSLDPNSGFYDIDDPDHYILLADNSFETAEMFLPGLPTRQPGLLPDTLLINGHGQCFNPLTKKQTTTPLQVYNVEANKRYRFRFIAALAAACAVQCQVEKHTLLVIATDSFDVKPRQIDTLYASAGERYDFVIKTDQYPQDYFIRCSLIGPCESKGIEQVAILRYKVPSPQKDRDIPLVSEPYPTGITLNFPNTTCFDGNSSDICVSELSARASDLALQNANSDYTFYLGFDNIVVPNDEIFAKGHYPNFMNLFSNLTLKGTLSYVQFQTPSFSLLTQRDDISEDMFCDTEDLKNCSATNVCTCTHRLKVRTGSIVDFYLLDLSSSINVLNHVFHLHGNKFLVLEMGQLANNVRMSLEALKKMEDGKKNSLPSWSNDHAYAFKDTVAIPSKGYAKIRIRAYNPGFWYLHCHWEAHMLAGMSLVLQVGEHIEMVNPPANFPKCGNFQPPINDYDVYTNF